MTRGDQRDWFRDLEMQDEHWKMGYAQGRGDWKRELISGAVGYAIGSKAGFFSRLVFAALFVFCVFIVIKFWWFFAFVAIVAVAWKTFPKKGDKDQRSQYAVDEEKF